MNRISLIASLAALLLNNGCAQTQISAQPLPLNTQPLNAVPSEEWVLDEARSDEFNAKQIDYSKWLLSPGHVQTWTWNNQENAKIVDGMLNISMTYVPHTRSISNPCEQGKRIENSPLFFESAMLKSKASGTVAYYEARIKGVATFPGFSPAFWMYSKFDDANIEQGSVRYSEIDVVELQQRENRKPGNVLISDHNLHAALTKENAKPNASGRLWRRPGKYHEQENVHTLDKDPGENFHVFAAKVSKDEIIWYVDKIEVGRAKNEYWHQLDMNVALSLGLRQPYTKFVCNGFSPVDPVQHIENFDAKAFNDNPPTMTVDYVRVWKQAQQ